ncbi:hypothetical protein [Shimia sp. SDUM112013]|uniref:hypothetical protein n=1 Tax=Shimia sp. SDUM112013 TaxID=3136160 RepID=UPI0032EC3B09
MTSSKQMKTAGDLLFVLVVSFATLVPGGPIETRDFSGLGGAVFWGFNAFLIGLALVAILAAIGLRRHRKPAAWAAITVGWGYIFVIFLDLGHVFPVSPDPIPLTLGLIEILVAMLAAYVIHLSHAALGHF